MKIGSSARFNILLAMVIFGTISIVVRGIALPSAVLACGRALIGTVTLLIYLRLRGQKPDMTAIRRNARWLIPSGLIMAFNWIFLFEAYRYTTVATATLCYYMAPTLIVLASPLVLKEKLTGKKLLCAALALLGMVFVSGVTDSAAGSSGGLRGVLYGLAAAVLYAGVILCNKRMGDIPPLDRTSSQLLIAGVGLLPYIALTGQFSGLSFAGATLPLLLLAGTVYTGFAYALYFGGLPRVSAQTAAILSYVDPVVAVLVSAAVFREGFPLSVAAGTVLILGAAFFSEWEKKK